MEVEGGKYATEAFVDCVGGVGVTVVLSSAALTCVRGDVNKPPGERKMDVAWREDLASISTVGGELEAFYVEGSRRREAKASSEDERIRFTQRIQQYLRK